MLTLLLPMVLCASQAIATDYISDLILVGGSKAETKSLIDSCKSEGWILIDKDLNAGAGGDYVYLLYKTQRSDGINRGYITGFYIKGGTWPIPDEMDVDGCKFELTPYVGGQHFVSQKGDLNSGTGVNSDAIHLYYTRAYFTDDNVVSDITFNSTQEDAEPKNGYGEGYDLNDNAGGEYIYMHVSYAQAIPDLAGEGTVQSPYIIRNGDDWHVFVVDVANGLKSDKVVGLANNIETSEMVGTADHPFTGYFAGAGREIKFNLITSDDFAAPFRYVKGATINGVKTSGSVIRSSTGNGHASGLVGACQGGSITIQNCVVNTNVQCPSYAGGIVGHAGSSNLTMEECVFGGSVSGFQNYAAGLIGWCDNATLNLRSCMVSGELKAGQKGRYNPIACKWADVKPTATADDVFYLNTYSQNVPVANQIPGLVAQPVSAKEVKNVWDDPFTAADGTTYFAAHLDSPKAMPYKFRFENSLCDWTVAELQAGSGLSQEDSYEGKSSFKFAASNHAQYLISPELTCRANQKTKLYLKGTSDKPVKFQLGLSGTTADLSSFSWTNVPDSLFSKWGHIEIETKGKFKYMAIKYVENCGPVYVDYFTIEEYGTYTPEDIVTTEVTKDDAILQWDGNSDTYTVRYRPQPYFLETFEGENINWSVHNEGGNSATNWRVTFFSDGTNLHAHSGKRVVFGRSLDYAAQTAYKVDNWLFSPQVELGGILSYWLMDDGINHEHYEIWVSTTECVPDAFEKVAEPGHGTQKYQWEEIKVDLSKYAGKKGYIAFRLIDEGKDFLSLDDIALYASDWKTVTTETPSLLLTDLIPGTTYEYQVQGSTDGQNTNWSAVSTFTTESLSQDEIDGIEAPASKPSINEKEGWYGLSGVRIRVEPTQPGLYINNGRKVLRK